MSQRFSLNDKTGDIVTTFPQSSTIFKKYKIDFCCGGNRPIQIAAEEKGLKGEELLQEIHELWDQSSALNEQKTDWMKAPFDQIIDTIIHQYHASLFEKLPEISQYVTKIMRVHGANHPELFQVHDLFHKFKAELEEHSIREEQNIFPLILDPTKHNKAELKTEFEKLEREHESCGNLLEQIREITHDYQLPEDACKTYQLTFKKLIDFEDETFQHVHLENNVLFPRVLSE
ncbi:MAG TPA: iron-sulfur cluster repair di-iron protein [Bacillota bacterium]|nr:iron-sulfur cluster repair di-iron protein [Bacillota bacterium]